MIREKKIIQNNKAQEIDANDHELNNMIVWCEYWTVQGQLMNAAMMPQGLGFPHISASRQSAPVLFIAIGFVWS